MSKSLRGKLGNNNVMSVVMNQASIRHHNNPGSTMKAIRATSKVNSKIADEFVHRFLVESLFKHLGTGMDGVLSEIRRALVHPYNYKARHFNSLRLKFSQHLQNPYTSWAQFIASLTKVERQGLYDVLSDRPRMID